jgi:hypothetical protein
MGHPRGLSGEWGSHADSKANDDYVAFAPGINPRPALKPSCWPQCGLTCPDAWAPGTDERKVEESYEFAAEKARQFMGIGVSATTAPGGEQGPSRVQDR